MGAEVTTDIGNAVSRVFASLQPDFELCTQLACTHWAQYCESPIEVMLGAALSLCGNLRRPGLMVIVPKGKEPPTDPDKFALLPQFEWKNYRFDFAIINRGITVLIECDGHDFHERTKEQAANDRQKDRAAQEAGFPILRFTGSEIHRDAGACAHQIVKFIYNTAERQAKP